MGMDWDTRVMKWVSNKQVWRANETSLRAPLLVTPTTVAGVSLQNGEPTNGLHYVILAIYAQQGGTPAALNSFGVHYQISDLAVGTAGLTADLATQDVVVGMLGNSGRYGGAAVIEVDAVVLDDRWAPIGYSVNTAVISLSGSQLYVPLDPVHILPPGAVHSLDGVASAVDATVKLGWVWAEVDPAELDSLGD